MEKEFDINDIKTLYNAFIQIYELDGNLIEVGRKISVTVANSTEKQYKQSLKLREKYLTI